MTTVISANTRIHLAESLPRVEREMGAIANRIGANLARPGGDEAKAVDLTRDLIVRLIEQARTAIDSGRFANPAVAQGAVLPLQEAGYDLPRVGDALVPIVRDVLGTPDSRQVAAAWSDTFWALFGKERHRQLDLAS